MADPLSAPPAVVQPTEDLRPRVAAIEARLATMRAVGFKDTDIEWLLGQVARLTDALTAARRTNERTVAALREVADYCDAKANVPFQSQGVIAALDAARNLCLAALAGESR